MKKILIFALIITTLAISAAYAATDCCSTTAQAAPLDQAISSQTTTGLIPPPSIYTPFGGTTVTELHVSDNDILGIIKQVIPAVSQALREDSNKAMLSSVGPELSALSNIDFDTLIDAINGIRDIRFLMIQYNRNLDTKQLLEQFDSGVAKVGTFSKIVSDFSNPYTGFSAVYAQSDNGGFIGYVYQPRSRQLIAARVVGSLDYVKLTNWAVNTGKMFYGIRKTVITSETQPQAETTIIETQPQAD